MILDLHYIRTVADGYDTVNENTMVLSYEMGYMSEALNPDELYQLFIDMVPESARFDTIVGTGISGCLAVPELARRLAVNWALVRKPDDRSHSPWPIEGRVGKRWLLVDDLISTGRTFARVWDVFNDIRKDRGFDTQFAGAFLYNEQRFIDPLAPRFSDYLRLHSKESV